MCSSPLWLLDVIHLLRPWSLRKVNAGSSWEENQAFAAHFLGDEGWVASRITQYTDRSQWGIPELQGPALRESSISLICSVPSQDVSKSMDYHWGDSIPLFPIIYRNSLSQVSMIEMLWLDNKSRGKRPVMVTMPCFIYGTSWALYKVFEVNEGTHKHRLSTANTLWCLSTHDYYAYLVHDHCLTTCRTPHFIPVPELHHFHDHFAYRGSSLLYVTYDSCLLHFTCLTPLFGLNICLIPQLLHTYL